MRPLQLELTAFRSYDRATIDLRPHELVVITGDTGAGKTSLLDAVCFALFGRTPESSRPRDLLTLGHGHGEVRMTFSARDEVWRVTRRYGKDAPEPAAMLERLDGDGGAQVEVVGGEEAVGARLAGVVGMSYAAFTSAVLLAQGRFAEFLSAQPRKRDEILRELFGVASLEGARQAALANAGTAERVAELREHDAARLPAHGARQRSEAARAAREAAAAHAVARALRPVATRLAGHLAAAGEAAAAAQSARRAAEELPDEEAGAELIAALRAARAAVDAAERERGVAVARRAEAVAARDTLRERHGGGGPELAALRERAMAAARIAAGLPERHGELAEREAALGARREGLAELERTLAGAVAEHRHELARMAALDAWDASVREQERITAERDRALAAVSAAGATLSAAAVAARKAEDEYERAHRHDLAARLRAELAPGDACPVCGGVVDGEVAHRNGDLDALDAARESARAEAERASRAQASAQERARAARAAVEEAEAGRERARAALEEAGVSAERAARERPAAARRAAERQAAIDGAERGARDEQRALATEEARLEADRTRLERDEGEVAAARERLGAWAAHADPVGALSEAMAEVETAERAADAAATAAERAAGAVAEARAEVARLEGGPVASLRATAARVAARGRLEAPGDDLPAERLAAAAVDLRAAALDAARRHELRAERERAGADAARQELARRGAALGVTEAEQVEPAARRAEARRGAARARLAELGAAAAEARRLRAEAAAARDDAEMHRQVANDLRANGFPRFLLGRFRERLAVGASERLQELTGTAYRFAGSEPDPMAVVDMRRGERLRPAATLSGGERFLASLALALGLSDVAAESSGRLDCLFLDEGFSALDADSLEQALAGIERLAHDGRLVVVITHLPGVAERLGAAIHVEKDPGGVSRVAA